MIRPVILSTWSCGRKANAAGWPHLVSEGGSSLDAVEQACRVIEADPQETSVGYGGYPDSAGEVTLDASIMRSPAQCGSVCCVRRFMHPVSIARLVMEKTPHVMLAAQGAERFAREHGMEPTDLLSDDARRAWQEWRKKLLEATRPTPGAALSPTRGEKIRPAADPPHDQCHDTIGVLALDAGGVLAGACSTSGLDFKMPGRVGDSPIVGHGLYVDPRHGAAVATGFGELIMGVCGTFLAVEWMRRGAAPSDAAAEVIRRIVESYDLRDDHQVGVITLTSGGEWGSAALRPGFSVAVKTPDRDEQVNPEQVLLP